MLNENTSGGHGPWGMKAVRSVVSGMLCGCALLIAPMAVVEAYDLADVLHGGAVSGTAIFSGAAPEPRRFVVQKDADICGQERVLTDVDVRDGLLSGTVIVLEGVRKGKPFQARSYAGDPPGGGRFTYAAGREGALEIRSKGCNFGPNAAVVMAETAVEFVNEDPMTHTVHTYAVFGREGLIHRTLHNRDLRAHSSMEETFTSQHLKQSQIVRIGCDRHEFMQNWLYVVESPYFAITGRDGRFVIDGVPPGSYDLIAWHPLLGVRTHSVTLIGAEQVEVTVDLSSGFAP